MHSFGQSDWTPEAYRLREEARLAGERLKASNNSSDAPPTNVSPVFTSDWTLSAFQARENKRKRDELIRQRLNERSESGGLSDQEPVAGERQNRNLSQNRRKADQFFSKKLSSVTATDTIHPPLKAEDPSQQKTHQASPDLAKKDLRRHGAFDVKHADATKDRKGDSRADARKEAGGNQPDQGSPPDSAYSLHPETSLSREDIGEKFGPRTAPVHDRPLALDASFFNRNRLSSAVASLLFFLLLYGISHFSLPAYLKSSNPDLSLKLNKNSSAFLRELDNYVSALKKKRSDESLKKSTPASSPDEEAKTPNSAANAPPNGLTSIIAQSRHVLVSDPLNGEHYRLLGQLYDALGKNRQAYRLMMAASDISSGEIIAHDYILRTNFKDNHPDVALIYADRLFTIFQEVIPYYAPAFALIMKDNRARENLARLLVRNPRWRSVFFSQLVPKLADHHLDEISALMTALNKTSAGVTNDELKYFITSLISSGNYHTAHQTWLSLLPPEQVTKTGLIYNGGFDGAPTGVPFDWSLGKGKEVRAQINTIEGETNRVLNIEFGNGRVTFPNISQMIVLNPGNYRIEGKYKGEALGKRGLFWIVNCYRGSRLGESEEIRGKFLEWREFQFEIKIPEVNCLAQVLLLQHGARSPSEQIISGSISFDDIKITTIDRQ